MAEFTVLGCGMKVAIKCSPPQTGLLLGNLAYTGQTSSRNCPAGSLVHYGVAKARHQLVGANRCSPLDAGSPGWRPLSRFSG